MNLVIVAIVAIGALAAGFALAAVNKHPDPREQPSASDDWLDRARALVRDGHELADVMADAVDRSPADLSDDAIFRVVADIENLNDHIAAVSATAPTAMDNRVCRVLGVRARGLCAPYERELRVREVPGAERRAQFDSDTTQQPVQRLEEFEVALRDLHEHVELL